MPLSFNPFLVQGGGDAQTAPPQQAVQAPPQQPMPAAPDPYAMPAGSSLSFNPFLPRNIGQVNLVPTPDQQPAKAPAGTPQSQDTTMGQGGNDQASPEQTVGQQVVGAIKATAVGAGQGGVEFLQGVNELAGDIGQKLGLVGGDKIAQMKADYDSERAQAANLSFNRNHPNFYGAAKNITSYGAGLVAGGPVGDAAKAGMELAASQGLMGTVAGKIAGDVTANAVAGALQSPGQSQTPFADRGLQGLFSGAVGGVVSAAPSFLGSLKGAPTAERIAEQQATAGTLQQAGVKGTVGQIIGDSNGMIGQDVQGSEVSLSHIPFVGGKAGLIEQQGDLRIGQKAFANSLAPNVADIASLSPEEMQAAVAAGKTLPSAAIDKAYAGLQSETSKVNTINVESTLTPQLAPLETQIKAIISKSPSDEILLQKITDLQNTPVATFDQLWDFRKNLDDASFTAAGHMKTSFTNSNYLGTLRSVVSDSLQKQADSAGFGSQWKAIATQYQQNLNAKQVQALIETAYSPLGRGGMSPGRGELTFARNLETQITKNNISLSPEQKQQAIGITKVTKLVAKNLRMIKPGNEVLTKQGAMAAAAVVGGHLLGAPAAAIVTTTGAVVKAMSFLLNSNLGRNVLTYAGKAPMRSLKLQAIANKVTQSVVSGPLSAQQRNDQQQNLQ